MELINKLKEYTLKIEDTLKCCDENLISDQKSWINKIYYAEEFFRAHLEIIDELANHNIYLIHFCIFPHFDDPSPIWGLDFVYKDGKITGAFHDFSPIGDSDMIKWFIDKTKDLELTNKRILPAWGNAIFSKGIIASGDITTEYELINLMEVVMSNLEYYLKTVGSKGNEDYTEKHNEYARFQKKNIYLKKTLMEFGYSSDYVEAFINSILFPEYE